MANLTCPSDYQGKGRSEEPSESNPTQDIGHGEPNNPEIHVGLSAGRSEEQGRKIPDLKASEPISTSSLEPTSGLTSPALRGVCSETASLCNSSPGLQLSCLPLKQQAVTWPGPGLKMASVTDSVNFVFFLSFILF